MKKNSKTSGVMAWLGFRKVPDFTCARPLGGLAGFAIALVALLAVLGGVATIVHFLVTVLSFGSDHEAIRNIGLIFLAVIGAPFVVWRAVVAQKQADTAEQSLITDQINKAVAGLGAEKTTNRIGRPVKILESAADAATGAPGRTEIEWKGEPLTVNDSERIGEAGEWAVFSESVPNIEVRVGAIYALERISQ